MFKNTVFIQTLLMMSVQCFSQVDPAHPYIDCRQDKVGQKMLYFAYDKARNQVLTDDFDSKSTDYDVGKVIDFKVENGVLMMTVALAIRGETVFSIDLDTLEGSRYQKAQPALTLTRYKACKSFADTNESWLSSYYQSP